MTLSDAMLLDHTMIASCGTCGRKHYYDPADIMKLLGDVPLYLVEQRFSCSRCPTNDFFRVRFDRLSAADRQRVRYRRLKEVKMVKRVIWEDE